MPESTLFTDPATDVYPTETPYGPVMAIFDTDLEKPGVRFDPDGGPAVHYMREVIANAIGHHGIGFTLDTLSQDDYVGFCQPDGVTIEVPWYLRDEREDVALDDANGSHDLDMLRAQLRETSGAVARLAVARALMAARERDGVSSVPAARAVTAGYYAYDPSRKLAGRKRDNKAAMEILRRIDAGEIDGANLDPDQKAALAKYSGTGGALIGADGKKGSAYEYYTPAPIADGIWNLLGELGFSGGKVLDPCAGTGVFGATSPVNVAMDAVELNATSGRVNQLVNGGPGQSVTISPFERVASATPDEVYDAVVTNVPFGDMADRGKNRLLDQRYQREPLENYFILRSLEKLRPGGFAVFIAPPRCVSHKGGKAEELRIRASYMAEFLGAYRLPNAVFASANADTMTDVMVFRKHSRAALDKIQELREQAPQTLIDAKVQWQPFIEGKYFQTEGKRFVLGEFTAKDPDKFHDVDRVTNPASVPEIAAMLRKFGGSRIDWAALDTTETDPIVYQDGDTLTHAGETLQLKDGVWTVLERHDDSAQIDGVLGRLANPYAAFEGDVSAREASECVAHLVERSRALDVPGWVRGALAALKDMDEGQQETYWRTSVVGLSVKQVLEERLDGDTGVNFLADYAALSQAMQRYAAAAKAAPTSIGGDVREGLKRLLVHYTKGRGFSAIWRGDVNQDMPEAELSPEQKYDGLRYRTKSPWVDLDAAREAMGEGFDPVADARWCLSADGKQVIKADDYYVGNYQALLDRLDLDLAVATDETVRGKLLRQKQEAAARVHPIDPESIRFNLSSPLVPLEAKAEFLRRFVHPNAAVVFDKAGKPVLDIDIPGSNLTDQEKLFKRFGDYLQRGSITLSGTKLAMSRGDALRELRRMVNVANEQFDAWTHGNPAIMASVAARANDPTKLRFTAIEDTDPLPIPGLHPALVPHGYQYAFARAQGNEFGGGNAFGVGVGKTLSALIAVQHVQSIGVKKKTLFVVPNSVMSNWHKEAVGGAGDPGAPGYKPPVYASGEDCLFIGWRDGQVNSTYYDEDLTRVLENRHSKIFMSYEAFERIRLRDRTISEYETFMRAADKSYAESEDKKADERAEGKLGTLMETMGGKTGAAPYLEDMGIDSLVADEAHLLKNASSLTAFKGAKFLSLADPSGRGMDAQIKFWYIRGQSPLKDGVLLLTATPISNSPQEIFSMLTLAIGHDRVNDLFLGVKGADDFMNSVVVKENQDDVTLDGIERTIDVFTGLSNVSLLRKAMRETFTIKSAADVGAAIEVPDRDEIATSVALPQSAIERLQLYKGAFRYAIDMLSERSDNRGDPDAFDVVSKHFGEPLQLIGHPFNMLRKMTYLILDPELDERATFFTFPESQAAAAQAAVDAFNAKKITEERPRTGPWTRDDAVIGSKKKTKKVEGAEDVVVETLRIRVDASIDEALGRIVIDSIDPATVMRFEKFAEKAKVDLDVTVPPKLAALIENVVKERAHPRGITRDGERSPIVKQIVFCDELPMHPKIKRVLVKHAGIPAGKITYLTGKINNSAEDILRVQDEFNATGAENKIEVIIANKKAEVGINLQNGTQAIHHLTIGWTPDNLEQRNGRAARQGNKTEKVAIYAYDADGTFDVSKRTMVEKKADWIAQVVSATGADSVNVVSDLSDEQREVLIDTIGDGDAMTRYLNSLEAKEAEALAATNRTKQSINLDTIVKQRKWLGDNETALGMVTAKVIAACPIVHEIRRWSARAASDTAKEETRIAARSKAQDAQTRLDGMLAEIGASAIFRSGRTEAPDPVADVIEKIASAAINSRSGKFDPKDIPFMLSNHRYPAYSTEIIEGGPIHAAWQGEVDMAQAMIAESVKTFTKRSHEKGALPAPLAEGFAQGKGTFVDGKPMMAGCFVLFEGFLGITGEPGRRGEMLVDVLKPDGEKDYWELAQMGSGAQIAYPGSPEFDAMTTRAAEIEDAVANLGRTANTFSARVPEVAQRRITEALAEYSSHGYKLPAPYFPFVATKSDPKTPVWDAIRAQQQSVVLGTEYGKFTVKATLAVTAISTRDTTQALIDFAGSNGFKLGSADFGTAWSYYVPQKIKAATTLEGFTAALMGDSEEALYESGKAYFVAAAPFIDFDAVEWTSMMTLEQGAILAARIKDANRPAGQDPEDDWVAISSPFEFRKVQDIRAMAADLGEPAAWVDKNRTSKPGDKDTAANLPGAPANTWVVRRKVYTALVAKHPTACANHRVRIVSE